MKDLLLLRYDYHALEQTVADAVRDRTRAIKVRVRQTVEDIILVGLDLITVKDALPHGHWLPWLQAEFGWSDQTARNFMMVADRFRFTNFLDLEIAPSALYLLAAPSVPDLAFEEAMERGRAGEVITHGKAKEIVARHKPAPAPEPATEPGSTASGRPFTYGTLCSGIEGAAVAFEELGWQPALFAEIDPYCCRLLQQKYPDVPNLGDVWEITEEAVKDAEERACSCSWPARRVSRSRLIVPGNVRVWMTTVANLSSDSCGSLANAIHGGFSGKTWRGYCPLTEGRPLHASSAGWGNAGMGTPTECWTLRASEYPSDAVASSLSDIIEETGDHLARYFLTSEQLAKMAERLRRNAKGPPLELARLFGAGAETKPPSSDAT